MFLKPQLSLQPRISFKKSQGTSNRGRVANLTSQSFLPSLSIPLFGYRVGKARWAKKYNCLMRNCCRISTVCTLWGAHSCSEDQRDSNSDCNGWQQDGNRWRCLSRPISWEESTSRTRQSVVTLLSRLKTAYDAFITSPLFCWFAVSKTEFV